MKNQIYKQLKEKAEKQLLRQLKTGEQNLLYKCASMINDDLQEQIEDEVEEFVFAIRETK